MKKLLFTLMMGIFMILGNSQTSQNLFNSDNGKINWLGIDFSHVKLIGDFSQFATAGNKSSVQIRDQYFPAWNKLILSEPAKYDIKGMLRKSDMYIDIDMLMGINASASVDVMESYNTPNYTLEEIQNFVDSYSFEKKEGIGILFIAECLNKNATEAYFHFIAINMETNEILIHERLRGEPQGFGLRNYWAGSIHEVIKNIDKIYYQKWKAAYSAEEVSSLD